MTQRNLRQLAVAVHAASIDASVPNPSASAAWEWLNTMEGGHNERGPVPSAWEKTWDRVAK